MNPIGLHDAQGVGGSNPSRPTKCDVSRRRNPLNLGSGVHCVFGAWLGAASVTGTTLATIRAVQIRRDRSDRDPEAGDVGGDLELPRSLSPEIAAVACQIMTRAEAMGIIDLAEGAAFSSGLLREAMLRFADVGIGRTAVSVHEVRKDLRAALDALNEDIVASPVPSSEWRAVSQVLGLEPTARLTGVSETSARRYLEGERSTPDVVADRLHHLAMTIADLLGAYNAYGVRRWFRRSRSALDGSAPSEILTGDWSPDDEGPQGVRALAAELLVMPAT